MVESPEATGLAVLDLARAGRFAEIRDMFVPQLRALVPSEALRASWAAELGRHGPVAAVGTPVSESSQPGVVVVRIPVACERGGLTLVATVTAAGQLAGLQLAGAGAAEPVAPWEPPDYADRRRFDEQAVTVGRGPLAVPGTLSLPGEPGPHPAVVLLAGSGPLDRDETVGRNKPLKDLAWGLASRGVAVVRFDKVTYARPEELAKAGEITVADEYVHHAVAAVDLLRHHPAVDGGRVFLVGHSLGGTVAPRVAAAVPAVAGLVVLAGGTQPLHWAIVRQIRYLAALDPATSAASEPAIAAVTEQARLVDSPGLSASTPAGSLPFGVPASYWLDLRSYEPVRAAAALRRPMLILQGGRDYQVTTADDLARWRAGLGHRHDVTIRVYPRHNHMFFPGTGPSTPAEYEPVQHVDQEVVADIAGWLATVAVADKSGRSEER